MSKPNEPEYTSKLFWHKINGLVKSNEPEFELGDLVRHIITGKVGIVTSQRADAFNGLEQFQITGVGWVLGRNLDLVSSVKDTQT